MSLLKNITDEMYLSMKSGDKEKANTLRTLISKLKDQQIKLRKDISDEETLKIIKTLVKQRKESAEIYSKAGREELAEKENFEISILDNYLPKLMSDEDVLSLVKKIGLNEMINKHNIFSYAITSPKIFSYTSFGKTKKRVINE